METQLSLVGCSAAPLLLMRSEPGQSSRRPEARLRIQSEPSNERPRHQKMTGALAAAYASVKCSSVPHVLKVMGVTEIRAVICEVGASGVDDGWASVTSRAAACAGAAGGVT